ncbi:MAG: phospholipase, partial [Alphaproteobacteria bacterium]|nr:phospholipase [Alphaproteobacteria bacterium]
MTSSDKTETNEAAADLIARLVPAVLRALHALEFTSRHLSPNSLPELTRTIRARPDDLAAALGASKAFAWPDRLGPVRDCLKQAGERASESLSSFTVSLEAEHPMLAAYRSLRGYSTAAEAIYPLAPHLKPVSQFFLEEAKRDDAALAARLAAADPTRDGVGFMHVDGPAGARGAFSLYVPEYYDPSRAWPLVVAMHGGSGNGGAFLWSWVREARSRGLVVLAPTAKGSTWSLMEPEIDGPNVASMVERVSADWNIDAGKQLLTGMSDGGTFTYVLGLRGDCRFTHLAPVAAAFHPLLVGSADPARVKG